MSQSKQPTDSEVTDWDEIESDLLAYPSNTRGNLPSSLSDFDENELEVLKRLANRAAIERSRSPIKGNVIFLHGITGSDLAAGKRGDEDKIWVNLPRLVVGRIKDLALSQDGKNEENPNIYVRATRINKKYYARAVISLRAKWNVVPFAYDWRKSIEEASDALAERISIEFSGQPVHIVAHSMGGLVARNMILRRPEIWETILDPETMKSGGRLIMLGTPNYGSYAIVQAMTGEDRMMSLLERFDLKHDMLELLQITNSFLGSYQLLPSPHKLEGTASGLYLADNWPERTSISQAHLENAYRFSKALDTEQTKDSKRMVYVAGCGQPTIESMTIDTRGIFEYTLGRDGDGRVPHTLGLLPNVPTFYVEEVHGDLARNEVVLTALDDLLLTGKTDSLSTAPIKKFDRSRPTMRDYRSATDMELIEELSRIADLTQLGSSTNQPSQDEYELAEDAIIRAALGSGNSSPPPITKTVLCAAPTEQQPKIRVRLIFGDISATKSPLLCIGHYRGVRPMRALAKVDTLLGGWISLAIKQGMLGGALGETFYIPPTSRLSSAVVIAGMGEFGTFNEDRLRILMTNVAMGASALGVKSFACLTIGGGQGSLSVDKALRSLLDGIGIGLSNLKGQGRDAGLEEVAIVENDANSFLSIVELLHELKAQKLSNIELEFSPPSANVLAKVRKTAAMPAPILAKSEIDGSYSRQFREVRITVEEARPQSGIFRFSAITPNAVIPVRETEVNHEVVVRLSSALRSAKSRLDQIKYGRLLYEYLLPADFHDLIDSGLPIKLIVDRSTASIPWEMACYPDKSGRNVKWLGTDLQLSRQFRSLLTQAPGTTPPLNSSVNILVIADPAKERELQLPYARQEGKKVVEVLRQLSNSKLRINVESRIGHSECDMVEILALVLTGDFDVIHFAGHGEYDATRPQCSGWIFGRNEVLTAQDVFRARRVPRLVVANACFSGAIRAGDAFAHDELVKGVATIAQAFFERGVPNFLGSGWPIADITASKFSEKFYQVALKHNSFILDALTQARKEIAECSSGTTWGAYQFYGSSSDQLLRPPSTT